MNETYYQYDNNPVQPPRKKKTGLKIAALVLCGCVIGSATGVGGVLLTEKLRENRQETAQEEAVESSSILVGEREQQELELVPVNTDKEMTPAQVYAANVGSTVGITTSVTTNYWGYQTTSAASGSGFILTSDGYILTNYHVVEDSSAITVTLYDGDAYDAELIGYDESNDIAVLKVDAEDLPPVVLGDSDSLYVGDSVMAIGNPLGELTFSLTAGLVSALDREVTMSNGVTMDLIQTDCAINSGNSGGALFNLYGEVVGITNAKYSSNGSMGEASIDNIGFAIPINSVMSIVQGIIENGYFSKPYVGIQISNVSEEMLNYGVPQGVVVEVVEEESPAQKGGLQVNDIIVEVNGEAIADSDQLVDLVAASQPNTELNVKVYRKGEEVTLQIVVGEKIQSGLVEEQEAPAQTLPQTQPQTQPNFEEMFPWFFGQFGY